MPSIIPSWVYTLFASLVVGVIIVASCTLATIDVRNEAQTQQLTNLDEYVATQSLELVSHASRENQSMIQYLDLPSQVGNHVYWVYLANDSAGAWVSSGLGLTANLGQSGVNIPVQVSASGVYVSTYGRCFLECSFTNNTVNLTLSGAR